MAKRVGPRRRKAAELRAEGLSLRQSAKRLGVNHQTVANDLAAWDLAHPSEARELSKNEASDSTPKVRLGDFRTAFADVEPGSVDAVITDPPYEREWLEHWSALGEQAAKWLRPGGRLVAMSGQMFLPEVMGRLGEHLDYWWTVAYLVPGGQAVRHYSRQVQNFWKPVLVFRNGDGPDLWMGDVARSDVNDSDKRLHDWGQSESGMADLVKRVTVPGDLIVDPCAGAGTTGVVALALGRRFIGSEINLVDCATANGRLS
jgi:predicted methyltransferase